jgi:S-adenosylmethionine:tRNA ribosyltransferase-isomerase
VTSVDRFDYDLPEDLVAAVPAGRRDESRLMVLDRRAGEAAHRWFYDLPRLLRPGDLLVLNDARVIPARLHARRSTGGAVELLLVRPEPGPEGDPRHWLAMARCGGRLREGEALRLDEAPTVATLVRPEADGWVVALGDGQVTPREVIEAGSMPVPPYILKSRKRLGLPEQMPDLDRERYQTVFAREAGAVAAPTAGLHFTEDLLDRVQALGVELCTLSLLVGPGTFQPLRTERVEDHVLAAEYYRLPGETASAVRQALADGRRIVATGTTCCRVLEHVARTGRWEAHGGWTDLFIYPPFDFRVVSALITNFHLPRSSLLMLVAAFAGLDEVLAAYRSAVAEGYRFYSYGDAMLVV